MNHYTPLRLRGDLLIELYDAATFDEGAFLARLREPVNPKHVGRLLRRYAMRNTITFGGIASPLISLAQNAGYVAADHQMQQFVVGTNAAPPTRADAALGSPVSSMLGGVKTLADINRTVSLATGELIISVSYGAGDANVGPALSLCEAGVVLGDGTLFSRQVNPGVPKTNAFVAGYTWRYGLTA